MPKDMAASVRQRLRDLARTRNEDFDYVLRQYVMQRLLYRLSCSDFSEQFLLKGALLFWFWNENFHRPTRDIDLLSYGDNDVPHLISDVHLKKSLRFIIYPRNIRIDIRCYSRHVMS